MIYRKDAGEPVRTEELEKELKTWKEAARKAEHQRKQKERRADWWKENVVTVVGVSAVVVLVVGLVTLFWWDANDSHQRNVEFHNAQLACMPGWIERLDGGKGAYQYERGEPHVICTDGTTRWVAEIGK